MNNAQLKKISQVANANVLVAQKFYKNIMSIKKITPKMNHWEVFKFAIYKMCPDVSVSDTINTKEALAIINNSIQLSGNSSDLEYNENELKKRIDQNIIRSKKNEDGVDAIGRKKVRYEIYKEDVINFCALLSINGIAEKLHILENTKLAGGKAQVRAFYIASQDSKNGISKADSYAQATLLLIKDKNVLAILQEAIEQATA